MFANVIVLRIKSRKLQQISDTRMSSTGGAGQFEVRRMTGSPFRGILPH